MGLSSPFATAFALVEVGQTPSCCAFGADRLSGIIRALIANGAYLVDHDEELDWKTVRQVLRYFTRNPQAADTIEGVARWRLLDERIERNIAQVAQAIEWLVSRGFLVREFTSPSTSIFRLNQQQCRAASRFLGLALPGKRDEEDVAKSKSCRRWN